MDIPCRDCTISVTAERCPRVGTTTPHKIRIRCIPNPSLTGKQILGINRLTSPSDAPQHVLWSLSEAFRKMAQELERKAWGDEHAVSAVNPATADASAYPFLAGAAVHRDHVGKGE